MLPLDDAVPGYVATVAIQSSATGLFWNALPRQAATPRLVVASGAGVPADAAHFALSCAFGNSDEATTYRSLWHLLDAQPLDRVFATGGTSCALLMLPELRPVRLLDGGAVHGMSSEDVVIIDDGSAAPNATVARAVIGASGGAIHADGTSGDDDDDVAEPTLPAAIDTSRIASALLAAERFHLTAAQPTSADGADHSAALPWVPTSASAHRTAELHTRRGGLCVTLRAPMHLRVVPAHEEGDASGCERVTLHAMLFPMPAPTAVDSSAGTAPVVDAWERPSPRLSLRLVQWNVLDGCQQAVHRLGGIGAWLRERGADVVSLNEMNGWSDRTFSRLARSWGFAHSVLYETATGYHLAIASRWPMVVERAVGNPLFHHGALLVQVGGIRICVTHLSPRDASHRLSEASEVLRLERLPPRRPFLLVGDLNTLSPLDAEEHASSGLAARLRVDHGLTRKFLVKPAAFVASHAAAMQQQTQQLAQQPAGQPAEQPAGQGQQSEQQHPAVGDADAADGAGGAAAGGGGAVGAFSRLFGGGGATAGGGMGVAGGVGVASGGATPPPGWPIDYAPMRALLDGGFADTGHATSRRTALERASEAGGGEAVLAAAQNHSVPTLINEDAMHVAAMRLDYALVNRPLSERCAISSWITRDARTERLSDHYPLVVDLNCEAW